MRAVVVDRPNEARLADVDEPTILDPRDAIVRVTATAICGADLLPLGGYVPGFDPETVLGHEFVGVVDTVGDDVAVPVGARVVCSSTTSCGTCAHCRARRTSQCATRSLFGYSGVYPRLDGGQAELVRVPNADRCLLRIPEDLSDERAVFLADILPTGFAALERVGARQTDHVAVLGCGPVGLMAVMCASRFAASVVAVDALEQRRSLAAGFGGVVRAVAPEEAAEAVAEATHGVGADVVVEAAGAAAALDSALTLVRGRGTVSVVGAHFEPDYPLDAGRMFEHEISLRFHIGAPYEDRERLLDLVVGSGLEPDSIVSHRMPLADAVEAYRLFGSRVATKVVLQP
ncbi:MAG: alcohol dehydrogenase catalytic domain-containing protein [Actinomycetota bacterium]|nr:alcohol dehydrogenase catalytic domain-containing protein [Actinomycetota bacterium]